jgi:integrase/recombinase XerD
VTTENLPARIVPADDRAAALAEAFAASTEVANTAVARRRDLLGPSGSRPARTLAWLPWCAEHGIDPLGRIRAAFLLAWLADLAAGGDAESTRNRRLSTVSAWYEYLRRDEQVTANPVDLLKSAEKPKSAKKIYRTSPTAAPSREQLQALQRTADGHSLVASAFVSLLATTGVRVSELVTADVESIGQDRGHAVLSVLGKGGVVNVVPMPPPTWHRVSVYLESRAAEDDRLPARSAGARPRRPLLARRNGRRMTRQELANLLGRLADKAGLGDAGFTPHSLRNAFITDLLDAGVPIYEIQQAVRHSSPDVTIRYDKGHLDLDRHPAYRRSAQLAETRGPRAGEDVGR